MQEDEKTLILPSTSKIAAGDGNNDTSPLMKEDRRTRKESESKRKQSTSWKRGNSENSFSGMV